MTDGNGRRRDRLEMRRLQMRRFYLLTGLSTVVPGAGLLFTRRRPVGAGVLAGFAVFAIVGIVTVGSQGILRTALNIGVDRGKLLVVLCVIVVATLVWCAAILYTSMSTRPSRSSSTELLVTRLFAALCCVLVVFPAVVGARIVSIQRGVVATVFGDPATGPLSTQGVTPAAAKADPWADIPRVNIMLIGADSGKGRIGIRSDSMMVVSVDTKTGDSVLIGLPRNLDRVPFAADDPLHGLYPNGFHCIDPTAGVNTNCLLNGIWTQAEARKDLFPGDPTPGFTETRRALGSITGLTINQSVIIDLTGFQQLVDAMGGVTVDVKSRICMDCKSNGAGRIIWTSGVVEWIEPGRQHLNGRQALWYARSRAQSDDFSRMRRQRCVVGAMLDQSNPVRLLANYGSLADVLKNNVTIDIRQKDLPSWVDLVERIQKGTIRSLPVTDKVVDVGNPDYAKIRALVQAAISPQPPTSTTTTPATPTTTTRPPSSGTATTTEPDDGLTTLRAAC